MRDYNQFCRLYPTYSSKRKKRRHSSTLVEEHEEESVEEEEAVPITRSSKQTVCCVEGCNCQLAKYQNRYKSCLKCQTDFKSEYLKKGWDRICGSCYSKDFQQYKKEHPESSTKQRKKST